MSSTAEILFLSTLESVIEQNRDGLVARKVTDKHGEEHDLQIVVESNIGPRTRPCIVLIVDGGQSPHEKVFNFELRFESLYQVDDFEEEQIRFLQSQVAQLIDDRCSFFTLIYHGLAERSTTWSMRKVERGAGGAENDSRRGRDVVDRWKIWMIDDGVLKSGDRFRDFVYNPTQMQSNEALAARIENLEGEVDVLEQENDEDVDTGLLDW